MDYGPDLAECSKYPDSHPMPNVMTNTSSANNEALQLNEALNQALGWFQSHMISIALAILAGFVIYLSLRFLRRKIRRLNERPESDSHLSTIIGRTAARTTHSFMIMTAARLVSGYAHPPELIADAIRLLFIITAAFQGAIWAREFIIGFVEHKYGDKGSNDTITTAMGLIRLLVTVVLFAIALIVVLDNLGVNITGIVAGLGIGGIAIGLAAQGIFSDLFAALAIIFDKPFRVGDQIQYDQTVARVEFIGLKSTKLLALTGEHKIISNASLLQKEISNFEDINHRRVSFPIGVVYQTDPEKAARIPDMLRAIIEADEARVVRSGFSGFGASSLDFECIFDVRHGDINAVAAVRHRIGLAILRQFKAEGLEFAYPTQTTFTAAPDGTIVFPYAQPK
jgi:small-conductance mechanosensitive channel